MIALVDMPGTYGRLCVSATRSEPTISSFFQSPPFTSTSGLMDFISSYGVSSEKRVTKSTTASDASTSALCDSSLIGLWGFKRLTEASEFSPTMRISPSFLASFKYRMCPICSRSKQPLVKTIFSPSDLSLAAICLSSLLKHTLDIMLQQFCGFMKNFLVAFIGQFFHGIIHWEPLCLVHFRASIADGAADMFHQEVYDGFSVFYVLIFQVEPIRLCIERTHYLTRKSGLLSYFPYGCGLGLFSLIDYAFRQRPYGFPLCCYKGRLKARACLPEDDSSRRVQIFHCCRFHREKRDSPAIRLLFALMAAVSRL